MLRAMNAFAFLVPAADVAAILLVTLALYRPRHQRHDLAFAYLAVNIGVLAVAEVLGAAGGGVGVGLGLLGVLAIIRLRSLELDQHEVAYYFSALALGVIGGLGAPLGWMAVGLMGAIVLVAALADAPAARRGRRSQLVVLDRACADEDELRRRLEDLLGGRVVALAPRRVDLVNDTTWVDVRYIAAAGGERLIRPAGSYGKQASEAYAPAPQPQGRPAGLREEDRPAEGPSRAGDWS
ncbi:MAG: DUF4956 domain-containing protein [Propionibacteriaceae bacterium]|jgi:hypothetical protein|nr:DUF4956 domain-containing protein [Propionibacteriaceae bacterium]